MRGDFKPFVSKSFSNLTPLLSITFPKGFQKFKKKFGHWTLGSGGKKTGKRSEQIIYFLKNLFWAKRPSNGVRKCDGQTDKQTHKQTYGHFDL